MANEGTGWGGEFHLATAAGVLTELIGVTEVGFPEDSIDEIEVTTLKAPGRRKQYIAGLIDGGSFTVALNYDPGDATDLLLTTAKNDAQTRAWEIHIPDETGTPARRVYGTGYVSGYVHAPLSPGAAKTSTLTIRVSGAVNEGAIA